MNMPSNDRSWPMGRGSLAFVVIAGLTLGSTLRAAENTERVEAAWKGFPVFLWMTTEGPKVDRDTFRALENAQITGTNVESHQSSSSHALAGMNFYVGHLAGKGDLHLRKPEESTSDDVPELPTIRPVSLSDPETLRELLRRVESGIRVHGPGRPLAYSLDDEISVTYGIDAVDYSFDEFALSSMREWLKNKYETVEGLNEVWGSTFSSFDQAIPETTPEIRSKNAERPLAELNFASWSDHREFMAHSLMLMLQVLSKRVTTLEPGVPVGFLGGQAPSAFGGFDWWSLARTGTFFEAYDHGLAPRMLHDFASPSTKVVSTLFLDPNGKPSSQNVVDLWRRVARGDDGVIVWSSDRMFKEGKTEFSMAGRDLLKQIPDLRRSQRMVAGAKRPKPEIYVYLSQASVRALWMLDSWGDGDRWHRRLTSHEHEHSSSIHTREGWGDLLGELSLPWAFLDSRDLVSKGGAELGAKVIVLNEALALSDQEVHELLRFVAAGGTLIADAHAAMFDEHLRGRNPRALSALFGLRRNGQDPFSKLADWRDGRTSQGTTERYFGLRRGERSLKVQEDLCEVMDLGYLRRLGDGEALYLNLDLRDYSNLADEQPLFAEDLRRTLSLFLGRHTEVALTPRLDYDITCRRFRLHRFGTEDAGLLLIIPNYAPLLDKDLMVNFNDLKTVVDPTEGYSASLAGSSSRFEIHVSAGKGKWLRYERQRVTVERDEKEEKTQAPPPKKKRRKRKK